MARALCIAGALSIALGGAATHAEPPQVTPSPAPAPQNAVIPSAPLPTHPGLLDRRLANGVRCLVLSHANPARHAEVWLHVAAGSLCEPDGKEGVARFIERMAFEGSENFPPGSVAPFLEAAGIVGPPESLASTGLDQTVFHLGVPIPDLDALDRPLLLLADVAGRLSFPEEAIERVRPTLYDARRSGVPPERRLNDLVLERLTPGSRIAAHPVLGLARSLASMTRADLAEYYARWFAPEALTVVVVADADAGAVFERVAAAFSPLPARPLPERPGSGVVRTSGRSVTVVNAPQFDGARVTLARVEPAAAPVLTIDAWRSRLVERLALQAFNARLDEAFELGRSTIRLRSARAGQVGRAVRSVEVEALGAPDSWARALTELLAEIGRAREGFTHEELGRVRDRVLATAGRTAASDPARPSAQIAALIADAVGAGETVLSAAQERDLGATLLPTISDDEISRAFSALIDPGSCAVVVTVPARAALTEQAVAAVIEGGPDAVPPPAPRPVVLAALPVPGEVRSTVSHAASSVTTFDLANNARVHYRMMEHRHELVTITALMPGGELLETPSTRGTTRAAAEAFRTPATSALTAERLGAVLAQQSLTCAPSVAPDALILTVTAPATEAEAAFQLVHALLTDATLSDEAVEAWRARQLDSIAAIETDPAGRFAALLPDTIYPPGERRMRPLSAAEVKAVTADGARAALGALTRSAPLEFSVVGNIDASRAAALIERYMASLPGRPALDPHAFDTRRALARPDSARIARVEIPGSGASARVLVGFFGPDATNVRDSRLLALAARALTARLGPADRRAAPTIAVRSAPAEVFPGFGLFYAVAPVPPAEADAFADATASRFAEFAASGPTPDEIKAALRKANDDSMTELLEPEFWTRRLRDLDFRGARLDDVVGAPAAMAGATAEEIREAFARYHSAGPAVRVIVTLAH